MIKMKKFLAGLTAFTMLGGIACMNNPVISKITNTVSVGAETLANGLTYEINEDGTGITITGCSTSVTEIEIPAEIDGLPVTDIGNFAFWGCTSLTSVTIPDSVTSIAWNAFGECTSLTSVVIPNSVTRIGGNAFSSCTSLTSIEIPDSVTNIESGTFSGCTSLTSIEIPDSVTNIEGSAFAGCTSLTSVVIPDSVTSILLCAFERCTSLTSVVIPDSVTEIEYRAFYDCTSLTEITIPASVTSIGDNAFGYYYNDMMGEHDKVENFTIKGYTGTEAERYATENVFNFVEIENTSAGINGDIDGDGEVTSSDALMILQMVVGLTEINAISDLDKDIKITSNDALMVLQDVVGIIDLNEVVPSEPENINNYHAIDYIGMTVGEVVSMYGNDYNYGVVEGGYFINYDFANGLWLHAGDNADENGIKDFSDIINYIFVFDGVVTDNISIGMTASQIRNATGLDIALEVDEIDGIGYSAYEVVNGYEFYMNFSTSYVLEEVLIKNPVYSTTVYPAIDYMGMTVGKVLSIHGYDYNYSGMGGAVFINYKFADGLLIHAGDNADENGINNLSDSDIVKYVVVYEGMVTDNISIGMTASQIRNATGLDIALEVDEIDGIGYFAYEVINGYEFYMNFNTSYILEEVLIKNSAW